MKKLLVLFSVLTLSACTTTVEKQTRVDSTIKAKQYNSLSSHYMERPTFASIEKLSDGETVLALSMDAYGSSSHVLRFSKKHVDNYQEHINKFFKWEKIATERKDQIEKEIGRAPTWGNGISSDLKFTFYSGNATNHMMVVTFCAVGTCLEKTSLYFDKYNAKQLSALLADLANSKIKQTDLNKVYN